MAMQNVLGYWAYKRLWLKNGQRDYCQCWSELAP